MKTHRHWKYLEVSTGTPCSVVQTSHTDTTMHALQVELGQKYLSFTT